MIGTLLRPQAARKSGSFTSSDPGLAALYGAGPTRAGPTVSETEALTLPALFRGVDNLCSHLAMLPLPVIRRTGPKTKERVPQHRTHRLLNQRANPEMTAFNFRRSHMLHTVLWGNGVSEIEHNVSGQAIALWPLLPNEYSIMRVGGDVQYRIQRQDGSSDLLAQSDVIHTSQLGSDGISGYGLIGQLARENTGQALALAQYVQNFFGNNMQLGLIISTDAVLPKEDREEYVKMLQRQHQGSGNAFGAAFIDGGAKVARMQSDNEAAQLIESWTLSIDDAARWLNVPPPLLFELSRATFSNISELIRTYERLSLGPWFENFKQEFSSKLFKAEEQGEYFVEFITDALIRGDIKTRYETYSIALLNGILNVDEVRELENRNPLPDGKGQEHRVPLNTEPVGQQDVTEPGLQERVAAAHTVAFDDVLKRMDAILDKAVVRAEKAGKIDTAWMPKFLDEHKARFFSALIPCVDALAGAVRATLGDVDEEEWQKFVGLYTKQLVGRVNVPPFGRSIGSIPLDFLERACERFGKGGTNERLS